MSEPQEAQSALWKRIMFSRLLLSKTAAQQVAYVGVAAALCITVNMFEFKFADVQFSLTVFASVLSGILVGPLAGFGAAFLGDLLGYLVNSFGYLYFWWVALSVSVMALLAGAVFNLPFRFRGSGYVKLTVVCLLTLAVCSVGINTTGMYFYYSSVGFTSRAMELIREHFGQNSYFAYALVRLVFMGQLWNNLFNYALLFVALPVLNAIRPLRLNIG